ncbi:MAG: PASTA domain-containing protein [Oscillospiraceae bacterium]|nr:PASTA domain-containing protein [Oscillospiraceae bacterium]
MNFYFATEAEIPENIKNILCKPDSKIKNYYQIQEILYLSGNEVYYLALDLKKSKKQVLLCELLPLQFMFQDGSESQWNETCRNAFARLEILKNVLGNSAVPEIQDIFSYQNTIWYVANYKNIQAISGVFTPKQAILLFIPVMDLLIHLHEQNIIHGAIHANAIYFRENFCQLRDWNAFQNQNNAELEIIQDIKAISQLLLDLIANSEIKNHAVNQILLQGINGEITSMKKLKKLLYSAITRRIPVKSRHAKKFAEKQVSNKYLSSMLIFTMIFCVICCMIPLGLLLKYSVPKMITDIKYTPEDAIILPEVLYLPSEEAILQLETLGLQVNLNSKTHNPVIPENQVLTQSPTAGSVLQVGDVVTLTVSDGWTEYVPDMRNMLLEDATEILEKLGFVVDYEEKSSDNNAPDTVISQGVMPDNKLMIGSTVHLVISSGRENLDKSKLETVANYIGMDFEEAKALLSELYLYALQVDTAYYPNIPNGTIVSQDISAGEQVPQGTSIRMVVSLGQEVARVPDCVNQNAETAKTLLENAGFYCVLTYVPSIYALDTILEQSVQPDTKFPVGSQVKLTASVGANSYVISTGGWSGNPLPTFTTDETEMDTTETDTTEITTEIIEITAETAPIDVIIETAPEPVTEPQEPDISTMPIEIPTAPPVQPESTTTEQDPNQEYQDAPQTAPF